VEEGQGPRSSALSGEPEARREVRWSARRKEEVILRLLRGESLDLLGEPGIDDDAAGAEIDEGDEGVWVVEAEAAVADQAELAV